MAVKNKPLNEVTIGLLFRGHESCLLYIKLDQNTVLMTGVIPGTKLYALDFINKCYWKFELMSL